MTTLSFAAVVRLDRELGVALSANQLFTLVCARESRKSWLDLDAAQTTAA